MMQCSIVMMHYNGVTVIAMRLCDGACAFKL